MILTFLYVIATSVQSRRISFLKGHLRVLFQGNTAACPSILFYNKSPFDSYKESKSSVNSDPETTEKFMTSSLCANKDDARLGELLWYHDEMRLCTIYPQQKIDVSGWLTYHRSRTTFPLFANNCEAATQPENEVFVLVEADLESFEPDEIANATKIEDYGLIVGWTANRNIGLILRSDLNALTKLLIAAMEESCYINNGLILKRIETVDVLGKLCFYSDVLSSPADKKFLGQADWAAHVEKLRMISDTAKLASEQNRSLEVPEYAGLTVCPEDYCVIDIETRASSHETLDSRVSTPASLSIAPQDDKTSDDVESITDRSSQDGPTKPAEKSESTIEPTKTSTNKEEKQESRDPPKDIGQRAAPKYSTYERKASAAEMSAKLRGKNVKPPNILIFADSDVERTNVKGVLEESLGLDKFAIYSLPLEDARNDVWMENAALVVVCGNVGGEIGSQIIEFILRGGKLLALCSDVLHVLLPTFKTAEVRENELVHFSYGKWRHVRMMHHIFCYQASPIRARFSQEQEDVKTSIANPPTSAQIKDRRGKLHSFDIKVLGTEETWQSPSILLATLPETGGKVVFSQIHLEVDPMQYQLEESKFIALKESNNARLEIFNDLLETYLGVEVSEASPIPAAYTPAFFLGRHELKLDMLERLKSSMASNETLKMRKLELQFCRGNTTPRQASSSFLPILLHQCPENFSTIEYFENLKTSEIGRLVIYADIMTSSMDVLNGCKLQHGLAVITRQQTRGRGRGKNIWLSPKGCAMFTIQVYIPTDSVLGTHITILQHLVAAGVVHGIRSLPGYEDIDLRLKWPNDIYTGGDKVKLGGIFLTSEIEATQNICNVGVGMNLSNSEPTCCINDLIKMYNETHRKNLKLISYEQYFAVVLNEIERLLNIVQTGNMDALMNLYYTYWMHDGAEVTIVSVSGRSQSAKVIGIDAYGFLLVRGSDGRTTSVQPDGNSFDALKGLIAPK